MMFQPTAGQPFFFYPEKPIYFAQFNNFEIQLNNLNSQIAIIVYIQQEFSAIRFACKNVNGHEFLTSLHCL